MSGSERTAEERERDREARARRRAARGEASVGADPAPAPADQEQDESASPDVPPTIVDAPAPASAPEPPSYTPAPAEEAAAPTPADPSSFEHATGADADTDALLGDGGPLPPAEQAAVHQPPPESYPEAPPPEAAEQHPGAHAHAREHPELPPPPESPPPRRRRTTTLPPLPPPPGARRPRAAGRLGHSIAGTRRGRMGAVVALLAVVIALIVILSAHSSSAKPKPAGPVVVKILIPEGKTRLQIAEIAAAKGLKGSYRVAARHSALLDPTSYGAPKGTPDLEGFLFPATYDEYPGAPVDRLVAEQLVAFKENFSGAIIAAARALHETPYQLLIVASMVEREAQIPSDRAKIAAVIYNRLAQGMVLGIDASLYYAVELETNTPTYTKELTYAQLHINSPYNTRTHTGLPPTPISNPGTASIEAAAHPAHVSYVYYVAGADGCGEQVFSNTLAEFETNVAAYEAAVKKNGGQPPVCKKK